MGRSKDKKPAPEGNIGTGRPAAAEGGGGAAATPGGGARAPCGGGDGGEGNQAVGSSTTSMEPRGLLGTART